MRPSRPTRLVVLTLVLAPAFALADEGHQQLGWVARDDLAPDVQRRVPEYCAGAYVEPAWPEPLDTHPEDYPIRASADAAEIWVDERAVLMGAVELEQGNRTVTADQATYVNADERVLAEGNAVLREPGLLVVGDAADIDLVNGTAQVDGVEFLLYGNQMRGNAARIERDEVATVRAEATRFTRCEPGNDSWMVHAREITVKDDALWGTARNAVMRVGNVPVFYTPLLRFPVTDERMSGWLFAELGYGDEGADIGLPYYFNLAPNYDAIVEPRYIQDRGFGIEGNFRHLSGWSEATLGGAFLYDDDLYNGELDRDDFDELGLPGPFDSANRWLLSARQLGDLGRFRTIVDYTEVSDDDYFRDLGTDLDVANKVELDQRGELQFSAGGLFARFWAQGFQNLDDTSRDPYDRLPELAITYRDELFGPFRWSLASAVSRFDRGDDPLNVGVEAINGDRIHVEPRLHLPGYWPFGFLRLTGGYRYTSYDLEDVPVGLDEEPDRSIWMGNVDGGLFFEREFDAWGGSWIHTLEPRVYYLYQEFEEQAELPRFDAGRLTFAFSQLFRDNRFAGIDRIGDANQLSAAVTTRLLDAAYGRERIRFSVGQIYYFEDRDVTLAGPPQASDRDDSSQIAAEGVATMWGNWRARTTVVYDPHEEIWDEASVGINYRRDNRHLFNVAWRFRDDQSPKINQSDVSLYWPVSRRFSVLGRWNYDNEFKQTIESIAGVEYNDCCWRVRFVWRAFERSPTARVIEDTDREVGVFLQVVFKGLAGIGGKVDAMMERSIGGYRTEAIDEI